MLIADLCLIHQLQLKGGIDGHICFWDWSPVWKHGIQLRSQMLAFCQVSPDFAK
uniref:Uncharacterized protein n=1 Tax=Anguilla anguilla TaxID=7936 RepID=A0A0E9TQC9_ANGAN